MAHRVACSSGRGDDTVGDPHRAQILQFELFELILLLELDKQFPVEQFEARVSQSTVPSPPLTRGGRPLRGTEAPGYGPGELASSEINFAICFLLEVPLRGFPFQIISFEKCRIIKSNKHMIVQRILLEKEILSGGSQAGNISQTSCPRVRLPRTEATRSPISSYIIYYDIIISYNVILYYIIS